MKDLEVGLRCELLASESKPPDNKSGGVVEFEGQKPTTHSDMKEFTAGLHVIGDLPASTVAPLVTCIVAACGVPMPHLSPVDGRSPVDVARTLATVTKVDLNLHTAGEILRHEMGCFVGGMKGFTESFGVVVDRNPVRAPMIRAAKRLVSTLTCNSALGVNYLLLLIPVGAASPVQSLAAARELVHLAEQVGKELGIVIDVVTSDASAPISRGFGPSLAALDVIATLRQHRDAPMMLRSLALRLAGRILESSDLVPEGEGMEAASLALREGWAWERFARICFVQGGFRSPPLAYKRCSYYADARGQISAINQRRLLEIATLAGAEEDAMAGIRLDVSLGDIVEIGDCLFEVHAHSQERLVQSFSEASLRRDAVLIEPL